MSLSTRLARLEAATTAATAAYGMAYQEGGRTLVYVCGAGEDLTPEAWAARYPAGVIVKRLVGVSPHDL